MYDRVPCVRSREAMVVGVFIHCASRELGRACAAGRAYTRYSRRAFLSTPPFPRTYASRTRTSLQLRIWTLYSKRSLSRAAIQQQPTHRTTTRCVLRNRVRSRTPFAPISINDVRQRKKTYICMYVYLHYRESTIGRGMEHASTYVGPRKGESMVRTAVSD